MFGWALLSDLFWDFSICFSEKVGGPFWSAFLFGHKKPSHTITAWDGIFLSTNRQRILLLISNSSLSSSQSSDRHTEG